MVFEVSGETLTRGVIFPRSYPRSPVTASPRGLLPNPPGQSYNRRHGEKMPFPHGCDEPAGCAAALAVEAGLVPRTVDMGRHGEAHLVCGRPTPPERHGRSDFFARRDCPAHRASSLEIWKNSGRRSYMGTHLDRGARGGAFNGHALAADPATSPRHSPHPTGCLTGKLPLPPGVDRGGLDLGVPKHCRRCLDPEALFQLSSPQVPQLIGCPSR